MLLFFTAPCSFPVNLSVIIMCEKICFSIMKIIWCFILFSFVVFALYITIFLWKNMLQWSLHGKKVIWWWWFWNEKWFSFLFRFVCFWWELLDELRPSWLALLGDVDQLEDYAFWFKILSRLCRFSCGDRDTINIMNRFLGELKVWLWVLFWPKNPLSMIHSV